MEVILKETPHHTWWVKEINDKPNRLSVCKLLGGKENYTESRYYITKGYGGWETERNIKPGRIQNVIKSVTSYNGIVKFEYWEKIGNE